MYAIVHNHHGKGAAVDSTRFDRLTRSISLLLSRRALAGVLAFGTLTAPGFTEARKKRKRRRRRNKKKIKRNQFGCVNVGNFCQNGGQCCSGICAGKNCQAHDTGIGCVAGDHTTGCGGTTKSCTTSAGESGSCQTTTGNAPFCYGVSRSDLCCTTDPECIALCGPGAACVHCPADSACGHAYCAVPGSVC